MNTLACRAFAHQPAQRLPSGAVVCGDYAPPAKPEHQGLTTCKAIVIGGAIPPALPAVSADAERIQAALLARRPTPEFYDASPAIAVVVSILLAAAGLAFAWPAVPHLLSIALPFTTA